MSRYTEYVWNMLTRRITPAACLAAVAALAVAAGLYWLPRLQAHTGAPVAVVFPPWWSEEATFRAATTAGVSVIGPGRMPGVIVVYTDSLAKMVGLYDAGAWGLIGNDGTIACGLDDLAQRKQQS